MSKDPARPQLSRRPCGQMVSVLGFGLNGLGLSLAGVTALCLCCWARCLTLTVPLSTQVYKWVIANCCVNLTENAGSNLPWTAIPCRGSTCSNISSHFMLRKHELSAGSYEPVWLKRIYMYSTSLNYAAHLREH